MTDSTKKEWINQSQNSLGTGIFWILDDVNNDEQMFVPEISYSRCQEIAGRLGNMPYWKLDEFRWVPNWLHGRILMQVTCGGQCRYNDECVNPACRCRNNQCQQKDFKK